MSSIVQKVHARNGTVLVHITSDVIDLLDQLLEHLRNSGYRVVWLDEKTEIGSFDELITTCCEQLQLPPIKSSNLNALKDVLANLKESEKGYVFVLSKPARLATNDPAAINHFLSICEAVNKIWLEETPMHLRILLGM